MKRKAVLTLALALVLTAMLAAPAIAANVNLTVGVDVNIDPGDSSRIILQATVPEGAGDTGEWTPTKRAFSAAELTKVTQWVIEFNKDVSGVNFGGIFQYDGNWWNQVDGSVSVDGAVVTLDLAMMSKHSAWAGMANVDMAKITLADWGGGAYKLSDIKSSYAVTPGGGGGGGSSKTGDTAMIALAVVALLMAAGATVFVTRKIKAH